MMLLPPLGNVREDVYPLPQDKGIARLPDVAARRMSARQLLRWPGAARLRAGGAGLILARMKTRMLLSVAARFARNERPTPLGAFARGLVAGALGAWAQNQFFKA